MVFFPRCCVGSAVDADFILKKSKLTNYPVRVLRFLGGNRTLHFGLQSAPSCSSPGTATLFASSGLLGGWSENLAVLWDCALATMPCVFKGACCVPPRTHWGGTCVPTLQCGAGSWCASCSRHWSLKGCSRICASVFI